MKAEYEKIIKLIVRGGACDCGHETRIHNEFKVKGQSTGRYGACTGDFMAEKCGCKKFEALGCPRDSLALMRVKFPYIKRVNVRA